MRVLVTGGSGFIGGFLVRRFLKEGVAPRVLARPSVRADGLEGMGASVVRGDLTDGDSVTRAVDSIETVFHCGARVGSNGTWKEFFDSNVRGTEMILKACVQRGVKQVVYLSSLGVYGPSLNGYPVTEDTPFDSEPERRGHYSHTKIIAERLAVHLAKQHGVRLVVIRPGFVYGWQIKPPAGLLAFQRGSRAAVIGRKDSIFPLNFVENLVDLMLLAATAQAKGSGQYNVLDDDHLTQEQYTRTRRKVDGAKICFVPGWPLRTVVPLIETAARILPHDPLKTFSRSSLDRLIQPVRYDTNLVRKVLHWQPRVGLEEGLQTTLQFAG